MHATHDHHNHSCQAHEPAATAKNGETGLPGKSGAACPWVHPQPADHADHNKHAGHSVTMFRKKFWISLVLTPPLSCGGTCYSGRSVTRLRVFLVLCGFRQSLELRFSRMAGGYSFRERSRNYVIVCLG